jgi:type III pantothenate kinase
MAPLDLLLVDIGNTRLKWATACSGGPIKPAGEISTKKITSTWIVALSRKLFRHHLVLTSVVPKLAPAFRRAFAERFVEINSALPELGYSFHYPKPAEIGADRLAAASAVHAENHFPAIIVACGTATAVSILDARGRFTGGIIAPGLQAQLAALLGATAQLPTTTLRAPTSVVAKSTQDAIRTGVILNFRGGVNQIVRELLKTLPPRPKPKIILTGGNADYLTGSLDFPHTLRPLLVFEGLRIIGDRIWSRRTE